MRTSAGFRPSWLVVRMSRTGHQAPERMLYAVQFHPEAYDDEHPHGRIVLETFFCLALGKQTLYCKVGITPTTSAAPTCPATSTTRRSGFSHGSSSATRPPFVTRIRVLVVRNENSARFPAVADDYARGGQYGTSFPCDARTVPRNRETRLYPMQATSKPSRSQFGASGGSRQHRLSHRS